MNFDFTNEMLHNVFTSTLLVYKEHTGPLLQGGAHGP